MLTETFLLSLRGRKKSPLCTSFLLVLTHTNPSPLICLCFCVSRQFQGRDLAPPSRFQLLPTSHVPSSSLRLSLPVCLPSSGRRLVNIPHPTANRGASFQCQPTVAHTDVHAHLKLCDQTSTAGFCVPAHACVWDVHRRLRFHVQLQLKQDA